MVVPGAFERGNAGADTGGGGQLQKWNQLCTSGVIDESECFSRSCSYTASTSNFWLSELADISLEV